VRTRRRPGARLFDEHGPPPYRSALTPRRPREHLEIEPIQWLRSYHRHESPFTPLDPLSWQHWRVRSKESGVPGPWQS